MLSKGANCKVTPRKVYPGYVLVEMYLNDVSWYVVRNTPGVTGFVGTGAKPVPLHVDEAEKILKLMGYMENRVKVNFAEGEQVRIIDGPFEDFAGEVKEIDTDKGKMKVSVSMFGRDTLVELEFSQVEKM